MAATPPVLWCVTAVLLLCCVLREVRMACRRLGGHPHLRGERQLVVQVRVGLGALPLPVKPKVVLAPEPRAPL